MIQLQEQTAELKSYLKNEYKINDETLFDEEYNNVEIEVQNAIITVNASCCFYSEFGGEYDEILIGTTNKHIDVEEVQLFEGDDYVNVSEEEINEIETILNSLI